MNQLTSQPSSGLTSHNVELYTARLYVQGVITGPFKRVSDLINRRDTAFFSLSDAAMTTHAQSTPPSKIATPVHVARNHIHFAATVPQQSPQGQGPGREYHVQKTAYSCYAFTDTFVIQAQCHLLTGTTPANLLATPDPFISMTAATIYLIARPQTSWQRDLVVVNKEQLEAMYLVEG